MWVCEICPAKEARGEEWIGDQRDRNNGQHMTHSLIEARRGVGENAYRR